jgi:tRNA uridine 5-carboxymethylaminomethyl modification enzyme
MQQIPGFENAKMFRPGYAIEYDYFPPTQLYPTLETKHIQQLYFAGQINGTTGYEEAACQGLMAGINAHLKINELEPLILKRSEAYIGVLIDDLVNKGTDEPYRMFTSRAEYRILLRQDNADIRLSGIARRLGLISETRFNKVEKKIEDAERILSFLKKQSVAPEEMNSVLLGIDSAPINQKVKLDGLLLRPQVHLNDLASGSTELQTFLTPFNDETKEQAEINLKYESYILKEKELADKMGDLDDVRMKDDFDYKGITSLSKEAREKLTQLRPATLGQASRVSGVSPSDIGILMVYLNKGQAWKS